MEMDWEALLDELWSYAASDPNELETKIRACLKVIPQKVCFKQLRF